MTTNTAPAPTVDDLTWVKGTHKGKRVQFLRTAMGHVIGLVATHNKHYRETYGFGYQMNNWDMPVWTEDAAGTDVLNPDPRKHREFTSLADAKAALLASARDSSAERIGADHLDAQARHQASHDHAAARRRELPLF